MRSSFRDEHPFGALNLSFSACPNDVAQSVAVILEKRKAEAEYVGLYR